MLQKERVANPEELQQLRIEQMLGNLRTASPGIVKEVDLSRQTVTVQLAIQGKIVDQSGVAKWVNMPLLTDVPVIGIDGIQAAVESVGEGKMSASILQDSNTIGSKAVDVAVDIANGKEIEKEYDIPYQLITKDNYEDFLTE